MLRKGCLTRSTLSHTNIFLAFFVFCGFHFSATAHGEVSIDYMMLRLATEFNDAKAQYLLGKKYYLGNKAKRNYDEAIKWFEKSAAQNHTKALYMLGNMNLYGQGMAPNYAAAYDFLSKAAKNNNVNAKLELANMLINEKYGHRDVKRALELYKQAARERHAVAAYKLGIIYYEGQSVVANIGKGKKWLLAAAELGHEQAQKLLKKIAKQKRKKVVSSATKIISSASQNESNKSVHSTPMKLEQHNGNFHNLLKKARSGEVDSQYAVGMSYLTGNRVEKNPLNSIQWFRKAAEQDHAGAQYKLGVLYRDGIGVAKSESEAIKWFRLAASWGVSLARTDLEALLRKQLIQNEKGFKTNGELAKPEAQYTLGMLYVNGNGVDRNPSTAAQWLLKAARQNHREAQFQLGTMYKTGLGVEASNTEAKKWLNKAAESGLEKADSALQNILKNEEKRLITEDLTALKQSTVYTLIQTASKGDTESQYQLGLKYSKGDGVEKNIKKALQWLQIAAEDDHMLSQVTLGEIYLIGLDTEKNLAAAAKWYKKAAEQGNAEAQYNLGNLYRKGNGVAMSNTKAVKWYRLAANQGHSKARNRLGGCRIC